MRKLYTFLINFYKNHLAIFFNTFFIAAVIAVPFAFILVYLFTRPALINDLDFSLTGQIGDTIGGITAPFFNLIAAVLIFTSFREQVKANKEQNKAKIIEAETTHIDSLLRQIDNELNTFNVKIEEFDAPGDNVIKTNEFSNAEAFIQLSRYLLNDYDNPDSRKVIVNAYNAVENLNLKAHYMLSSLSLIIKNLEHKPSLEKELIAHRLKGYYLIKLKDGFNYLIRYQANNLDNTNPVVTENFIKAYERANRFFDNIDFNKYYKTTQD